MALRLDHARRTVVGLMTDTCRVFRDPDGHDTDVLNATTLALEPPDPAGSNVYRGVCRVAPMGTGRTTGLEGEMGDAVVVVGAYRVFLPFDAPEVLRNDVVVMLTSEDPQLVGARLRVVEVARTSILVQRSLLCQVIT